MPGIVRRHKFAQIPNPEQISNNKLRAPPDLKIGLNKFQYPNLK